MAVEKVWKCDLCGEYVHAAEVRRVGVRRIDDRPEAADWIDVGPECHQKPVEHVLVKAAADRKLAENG